MAKKLANGVLLMLVLAALLSGGALVQRGKTEAWQASANRALTSQPSSASPQTVDSAGSWSVNIAGSISGDSSPQAHRPCNHHKVTKPIL